MLNDDKDCRQKGERIHKKTIKKYAKKNGVNWKVEYLKERE
jgi:hypothetical protein